MLRILAQEYPAPRPVLKNLIIAVLSGLFIALFLLYFEPFNTHLDTNENKVFQLSFFGCITTIVLVFFLYVCPLLLPNLFSDKNWKVGYQIILILLIILVIATFNSIYSIYRNSIPFSWDIYLLMLSRTCILSIFPTAFITIINSRNYIKQDGSIEISLKVPEKINRRMISSNNQKSVVGWVPIGPFKTNKPSNLGNSWAYGQMNVYSLCQSISNPNILYAGGETGGIYKSSDKGLSWNSVGNNLNNRSPTAIKIDPINESHKTGEYGILIGDKWRSFMGSFIFCK